jgi:hypothetical protein
MKMIGNQNQTEDSNIEALRRLLQEFEEARSIFIVPKYPLSGVSTRAEMVNRLFKLYPQWPCHHSAIATATTNVKCLDLTPFFPLVRSEFLLPSSRHVPD